MSDLNARRTVGTVRWYAPERGFGFIAPDDGGEDVYVRHDSIEAAGFRTLSPADRVEFQVDRDAAGPVAMRVRVTS